MSIEHVFSLIDMLTQGFRKRTTIVQPNNSYPLSVSNAYSHTCALRGQQMLLHLTVRCCPTIENQILSLRCVQLRDGLPVIAQARISRAIDEGNSDQEHKARVNSQNDAGAVKSQIRHRAEHGHRIHLGAVACPLELWELVIVSHLRQRCD